MTISTKRNSSDATAGAGQPRAANYRAGFTTAIQFLTRLSVSPQSATAESLRKAPLFFPAVGSLIGCTTFASVFLAHLVWPSWIAVLMALAIEAVLTGALHEDGLADFCDAFGGGSQREDILRILKDSRIGAYGTVGLLLGLALRAACLVTLVDRYPTDQWLYGASAMIAASGIGSWMIVLTMTAVPPVAQRQTLMSDFVAGLSWRGCLSSALGVLPALAVLGFLLPLSTLVALAMVVAAWFWLVAMIRRAIQGTTGDCLGCIGYVTQVLFLLGIVARVA